jgi:chemotaxis protein methyltransferase CheR
MLTLTQQDFMRFQRFIYDCAGITLADNKLVLVSSRLASRVQQCGLPTFSEYFRLLASGTAPQEVQTAIDLLTTNETYFFREPKHFEFLREQILATGGQSRSHPFRVWSAAGSTGEEAYSIGMVLEDCLRGRPWEVLASDISTRVLERARAGVFPLDRARNIPLAYLRRFCLQGQGKLERTLLVERGLRNKVRFQQINLNAPLPHIGDFDIVFLRNVLIYFNLETKRGVVERVLRVVKPGGWLLIGHSENLHNVTDEVQASAPAIYRKPSEPMRFARDAKTGT